MSAPTASITAQTEQGRGVVFRGGTVLTMDDQRSVLHEADVLVVGEQIAAVGPALDVPEGTIEIDAARGIVMPGMIDTHRHMWQTAMRGYGADWTLTQYFVWYYLSFGKVFRPEDIYAGNLLSGIEALDAGVTTTVDWSHGLQTIAHADAAVDALEAVPGFEDNRQRVLGIMNAKDKVPYVRKQGKYLYNFWTDDKNPRGLWRRTTLAEYRKSSPAWETVLGFPPPQRP